MTREGKRLCVVILLCLLLCNNIYAQSDNDSIRISFEKITRGKFTKIQTDYYALLAKENNVQIDVKHSHSGKKSLRILGGTDKDFILIPAHRLDKSAFLCFWAERWTKKPPFTFRVDIDINGRWKELYNGDCAITTGKFTLVKLEIKSCNPKRIRFRCTSRSGILIDDIFLGKPTKMSISEVKAGRNINPILIEKAINPVASVCITTEGILQPIIVKTVSFDIKGCTDIDDIEQVSCFYTEQNSIDGNKVQFGKTSKAKTHLVFIGKQQLTVGENYFWLSFKIKNNTNLDHYFSAACTSIELNNGKILKPHSFPFIKHKTGYAVRLAGQDGVHTYRIPGLATTNNGTLLAVYDVRRRSKGDLPNDIDIGLSRSCDKGQSWQKMQIIMDMGNDPAFDYDGVGDPCILVDKTTGTIWVAALWSHGDRAWKHSGKGMTPRETGQLLLVRSDDDGKTWSKPINITRQIKKPEWHLVFEGPGKGITMHDGTIVFPAQYRDGCGVPYATIIYSNDHGNTWHIGTGAKSNTTEAQVVELSDGILMLNMRDNRGGARSVCVTCDMGKTWMEHSSSRKLLPEPICMASLIKFEANFRGKKKRLLLFSNPNSTIRRENLTIKVSEDDGNSWPEQYYTVVDSREGFGYSCMTVIDNNTIGILYEGIRELYFVRYTLDELLKRGD